MPKLYLTSGELLKPVFYFLLKDILKITAMKKILLVTALLFPLFQGTKAQTADEIISNYLENSGGVEKWRSINSLETISEASINGAETHMTNYRMKDGRAFTLVKFNGIEIKTIFDGIDQWTNNPTMKWKKSDEATSEKIKGTVGDFPDPFLDYGSKGYRIELLGKAVVEGRECYKIKLLRNPLMINGKYEENTTLYYFDTREFLPVMTESQFDMGKDKMNNQYKMSNYQEIDGILFPLTITSITTGQGQVFSQTIKNKIKVNPAISEDIFVVPGSSGRSSKSYQTLMTDRLSTNSFNQSAAVQEKAEIPTLAPQKSGAVQSTPLTNNNVTSASDLETNIPAGKISRPDAIAVVIGNRDYSKTKPVDFAINDARVMKKYLVNSLGFQEGNILYYENATKGDFEMLFGTDSNEKGRLFNTVMQDVSDVFVFYSGHGAPGLKDQKGYFVPIECDPNYVEFSGFDSNVFYKNLGKLPAKSITVVLDACFSGATVFSNISPIVIKSQAAARPDKISVLGSSSGAEVSSWYNDKKHGLFTYFFLKAIQNQSQSDSNGDGQLTLSEIHKVIADNTRGIPYWARRLHGIEQHPTLEGKNSDFVLFK